jgi:hypothetical protein
MKALEWAGVLTWQNRITRIQVRERDLFGHWASRWRVIRTSNAYVQQRPQGVPASKSENQIGTQNQELLILLWHQHVILTAPLEQALQQLSRAIKGRLLITSMATPGRSTKSTGIARPAAPATCSI